MDNPLLCRFRSMLKGVMTIPPFAWIWPPIAPTEASIEVRVPFLPLIGASETLTFVSGRLKLLVVSVKLIIPLRTLTLSMFQVQSFGVFFSSSGRVAFSLASFRVLFSLGLLFLNDMRQQLDQIQAVFVSNNNN